MPVGCGMRQARHPQNAVGRLVAVRCSGDLPTGKLPEEVCVAHTELIQTQRSQHKISLP